MSSVATRVMEILGDEVPGLSESDFDASFESLAVDSFTLVSLRARIENLVGKAFDDKSWTQAQTPRDLIRIASGENVVAAATRAEEAGERRNHHINMPQMALAGLSESWLFKELGDLHWSMITAGLKCASSELKDGEGNRLYATFTRFSLRLKKPLLQFRENDALDLSGRMSRYGAGVFLSETDIGGSGTANIMSSFSKRGEAGSNMSLLKGQPDIPSDCKISALAEAPDFAKAYRERRAAAPPAPLFECEYDIIPQHDINGVGLLYFAAIP
ncbi:MAG: hypothetical protein HC855_00375 [Rhizobiales bacterium]|nr:hypothetical protein [Hyphomicrobiales bacterium]